VTARTERRSACVVCGAKHWGYEGVHYGSEGDHCLPCFNRKAAREMGIEFDQANLQPVTLKDADGHPHVFHAQSRLAPTGHVVEAFEVEDGRPRGYRFAVLGDFEADAMSLFALVYEKMRAALARKQVGRGELGWQLELDQSVTGRIEHDPESDLRLPIVTIDGREFRWEQLGHMLMTFEGFNLELCVRNSIDVVGGPLLDEE
jgi:hypothetical protein